MPATVSGAHLYPIYERLNQVENYHPLSAETFSDWALEAGDIITVTRDGKTYQSPVHNTSMVWRGKSPVTTVNTTGNRNRDPIKKLAKQKYGGGAAGMRNDQGFYYEINDEDGILHTEIAATESHAYLLVQSERARAEGQEYTLSGRIDVTASDIALEVAERQGDVAALSGRIDVTASAIALEVADRTNADNSLSALLRFVT